MLSAFFSDGIDEITVDGLTQWDKGQKLQITLSSLPSSFEVHFANKRAEIAERVLCTASNGVATIPVPNSILTRPTDAIAWIYVVEGDAGETVKTIQLPIEKRTKPSDYVYEENLSGASVVLVDTATGTAYNLYVSNGKLMMAAV